VRFRKAGDLRLVSHHDLMHCFERMLRRAAIPFATTQGFHPQPRMVFALSLALGIVGQNEIVDIELTEPFAPEELQQRLRGQAPPGLEILDVTAVPRRDRLHVRRAVYRLALPPESPPGPELTQRCAALLSQPQCWVERARPQPRRIDIRPFLSELRVAEGALVMIFCITAAGTARPEEVVHLLGLSEILARGGVLERTELELGEAEAQGEAASASPVPETKTPPLSPQGRLPEDQGTAQARDHLGHATPLVPGPMAFDA